MFGTENDWKTISSDIVHENPWWQIRRDRIVRPDGTEGEYYVLSKFEGVVVVPKIGPDEFLMVKLYRYPVQAYSLEFPAGSVDKGEAPEMAAERETEEETGYRANKLNKLGVFVSDPGHADQTGYVYLARDLTWVGDQRGSAESDMTIEKHSAAEVDRLVKSDTIRDNWTIVAWMKYRLFSQDVN